MRMLVLLKKDLDANVLKDVSYCSYFEKRQYRGILSKWFSKDDTMATSIFSRSPQI